MAFSIEDEVSSAVVFDPYQTLKHAEYLCKMDSSYAE
jgi:hypothetical protein